MTQQAQVAADPMDAFDAAMNPAPISTERTYFERTYFGEVGIVNATYYTLKKGQGKKLFDPTFDPIADRRTLIELKVYPLRGEYELDQSVFDFSTEWQKFTLPSLRALGVNLRALQGKFAQLKRVETGETYQSKPKMDGQGNVIAPPETKTKSAWKFVAIYDSRDECQQAADGFYARFVKPESAPEPEAGPAAPAADTSDPLRQQAAGFLDILWQTAGGNVGTFLNTIANTPNMAKYFNASSPEVEKFTEGVPF